MADRAGKATGLVTYEGKTHEAASLQVLGTQARPQHGFNPHHATCHLNRIAPDSLQCFRKQRLAKLTWVLSRNLNTNADYITSDSSDDPRLVGTCRICGYYRYAGAGRWGVLPTPTHGIESEWNVRLWDSKSWAPEIVVACVCWSPGRVVWHLKHEGHAR